MTSAAGPIAVSLETEGPSAGAIRRCFCLHRPAPAAARPLPRPGPWAPSLTCPFSPHRHLHNNRIQRLGTHSLEGLDSLETL